MKLLLFYRLAFAAVLAVGLPLAVAAKNKSMDKPVRNEFAESIRTLFQDSIPVRKKTGSKPQERAEKPPQDVQDERIREAERRSIKQVPRSIPKLKPQPVTDRIKMRRPPMKAPKKGFGGYKF